MFLVGGKPNATEHDFMARVAREAAEQTVTRLEMAQKAVAATKKLNEAGFKFILAIYNYTYLAIEVKREDLKRAYAAFGPLIKQHAEVIDPSNNEVMVFLKPKDERYSVVRFKYRHTITPGAKCRIEKCVSESYNVVCGVPA